MYNKRFVYVPVSDTELEQCLTDNEAITKHQGTDQEYHRLYPKCGGDLRFVSGGDMLLVYGHANLGKGIGTHSKYYGARALAKLMVEDGLTDRDFVIKLFSCNTGVLMPGQKAPYAERFANALAELGFRAPRVHGYVGFSYLSKTLGQNSRKAVVEHITVSIPFGKVTTDRKTDEFAKTKRVGYDISSGKAQQDKGGQYKMERAWKRFQLQFHLKTA